MAGGQRNNPLQTPICFLFGERKAQCVLSGPVGVGLAPLQTPHLNTASLSAAWQFPVFLAAYATSHPFYSYSFSMFLTLI